MNLTGQQIKDTYEGLLNIGATGLTGTLQTITDGLGNPLPMQVSETTVNFTGIVTGIVGNTGPAGPTGAQGPTGAVGPTGAGGASATGALQTDAAIDGTLQVVKDSLGNSSALRISTVDVSNYGGGAIATNVAFGDNALICNTTGCQQVAIGTNALKNSQDGIGNVAIGYNTLCTITNPTVGGLHTVIGWNAGSNITNDNYYAVIIGAYAASSLTSGRDNTAVGTTSLYSMTTGCGNTAIGKQAAQNATGVDNTALGFLSGISSGVDTAVVIGKSSCVSANCGVAIGNGAIASAASAIAIGDSKTAPGSFDINIGGCTTNSIISTGGNNTIIGGLTNCITTGSRSSIIGGYNTCVSNTEGYATIIGSANSFTCGNSYFGFLGGAIASCAAGYASVIIGAVNSCLTQNNAGYSGIYSGANNTISSSSLNNAILGGCCGTIGSNYANSVILGGNNIIADASNTVYVPNLKVTGQAASTAYAIGVTAAVFNVDWDNSNVQTVTLNGSGTVTMSNPIDGGVYTMQITQGTGGGHTLIWTNVKWPGGTPPSLSITAGAVDILTFIYGPTAYFGNANLNFS